jgi:hypothetical protein
MVQHFLNIQNMRAEMHFSPDLLCETIMLVDMTSDGVVFVDPYDAQA